MFYCSHSYNNITLVLDKSQCSLDIPNSLFFAKLLICVVVNQSALYHGQQVAILIINDEPNRAVTPGLTSLELCEPASVLFVLGVKHHPRPSIEC